MPESATQSTSVLLVGSTGMSGGRIAAELSLKAQVDLRLLARAAFDVLTGRGASVVDGDLARPATLDAATAGVEVVISAVQGVGR